MLLDYLILSIKNILNRKRRSWLTVIGIFIGIAAVISLVSLGQGLEQSIIEEFESIGSDKLFISPGGDPTSSQNFAGSAATLTEDDIQVVERTRGIQAATGVVMTQTRIEYNDKSRFILVMGFPTGPEASIARNSWAIEIAEGRYIRSTDRSNVLIGSRVAETMFNEQIGVRNRISMFGRDFQVIGVMKPTGDPSVDASVIIPIERARELSGQENTYDWIFAKVQEGFTPEEAKENVVTNLRQHRNLEKGNEDFTVSTPQDLIDSFRSILSIVQAVVLGIASISLLVGGVGIMNTMYTSVTERTREIGVMKAVGAKKRDIMIIFLIESGIIGLIGGIIGVTAGLGLSTLAAQVATDYASINISIFVSPELVGGSLLFAFILGTVSGVLPARNAARLDPAEALRYE
ncbi:MAG: ABC transporter permease [Candidatus Nanohaloarchaea archaeon]|nr:ABC transporter permease [Candidatus Nanohaloarchaea archaeon]